jgi:hypothetical protein
MTDEELGRLVGALVGGLPIGLVLGRIRLALRATPGAGGADARAAAWNVVGASERRDALGEGAGGAAQGAVPRRKP